MTKEIKTKKEKENKSSGILIFNKMNKELDRNKLIPVTTANLFHGDKNVNSYDTLHSVYVVFQNKIQNHPFSLDKVNYCKLQNNETQFKIDQTNTKCQQDSLHD